MRRILSVLIMIFLSVLLVSCKSKELLLDGDNIGDTKEEILTFLGISEDDISDYSRGDGISFYEDDDLSLLTYGDLKIYFDSNDEMIDWHYKTDHLILQPVEDSESKSNTDKVLGGKDDIQYEFEIGDYIKYQILSEEGFSYDKMTLKLINLSTGTLVNEHDIYGDDEELVSLIGSIAKEEDPKYKYVLEMPGNYKLSLLNKDKELAKTYFTVNDLDEE